MVILLLSIFHRHVEESGVGTYPVLFPPHKLASVSSLPLYETSRGSGNLHRTLSKYRWNSDRTLPDIGT